MKRLLFVAALVLVPCLPAFAASQPPVAIDKCVMGYETAGDDSVIGQGVAFTNKSHHIITAIRFNFTYLSKFNDVLGGTLETDTGTFSPGVNIDHTKKSVGKQLFFNNGAPLVNYYWQSSNPSQESLDHMKLSCTVDAISFQDGTVWTASK